MESVGGKMRGRKRSQGRPAFNWLIGGIAACCCCLASPLPRLALPCQGYTHRPPPSQFVPHAAAAAFSGIGSHGGALSLADTFLGLNLTTGGGINGPPASGVYVLMYTQRASVVACTGAGTGPLCRAVPGWGHARVPGPLAEVPPHLPFPLCMGVVTVGWSRCAHVWDRRWGRP